MIDAVSLKAAKTCSNRLMDIITIIPDLATSFGSHMIFELHSQEDLLSVECGRYIEIVTGILPLFACLFIENSCQVAPRYHYRALPSPNVFIQVYRYG